MIFASASRFLWCDCRPLTVVSIVFTQIQFSNEICKKTDDHYKCFDNFYAKQTQNRTMNESNFRKFESNSLKLYRHVLLYVWIKNLAYRHLLQFLKKRNVQMRTLSYTLQHKSIKGRTKIDNRDDFLRFEPQDSNDSFMKIFRRGIKWISDISKNPPTSSFNTYFVGSHFFVQFWHLHSIWTINIVISWCITFLFGLP